MRDSRRLTRLNKYLSRLSLPLRELTMDGETSVRAIMTTAASDATSKLSRLAGTRLLVARPDMRRDGDSDSYRVTMSTALFVLEKDLAQDRTPEAEEEQYDRLAGLALDLVDRITADTTSGSCGLVGGMSVSSVDVNPEVSLFGGWRGYSVEITFE